MKHNTLSFRRKLLVFFMLFTAVIFTVLWLLQTVFLQSFYNSMVMRNTTAAAGRITSFSLEGDACERLDELSRDNSLLVYVTDAEGNILYSADEYKKGHQIAEEHGDALTQGTGGRRMRARHGHYRELPENFTAFLETLASSDSGEAELRTDQMYFFGKYIDNADTGAQAVLYLGTNLNAVGSAARIIRIQLLIVTLLSIGIGFVLAWFMSRRFSQPISQLSQKAHTLGESAAPTAYQKGFCSELDELNETLDRTDEKLRQNKQFQNELLANVSHDLRTPLTMIKGYAEMIRDISHEDEAQCAEDVAVIVRETDRLTALVGEILEYSELQMSDTEPVMEEVDFSEVVSAAADSFESLYAKDGYRLEMHIAPEIRVRGNVSRLMRAVYNLLDNAVRHSGADKWVGITLRTDNGSAVLEIADHGAGIAPEELERIWEKYYTSRQRAGRGVSGLGLAIVRQIAAQHHGECRAVSEIGTGSTFYIQLPVCR